VDIQITIICENTVATTLPTIGEHGFAAFIETKTGNYLFDTGQGSSILRNAKYLKKDLTSIKKIFLSHGHYDHTGGLTNVLKLKKRIEVYAHPDIFSKKYARLRTNGKETYKYIGIKHKKKYFEKGDSRLLISDNGSLVPDPLLDDQSLILKTKNGLIIVLGCAHSGLINTIKHIKNHFKDEKLDTIIGGTHLGFLKEDQLYKTISHLKRYGFKKIGGSHCTGLKAAARLFQEFRDKFFFANVGTSIVIN